MSTQQLESLTDIPWRIFELALKHGAILVTPDYRLRPESEIVDALEDIQDFWKWIESKLPSLLSDLSPSISVDVSNCAAVGESAGGILVANCAALGMAPHLIKLIILQYAGLDFEVEMSIWSEANAVEADQSERDFESAHDIKTPRSVLDDYLESVGPQAICTRSPYGNRMHLLRAMLQHGQYVDLTKHPHTNPIYNLDGAGPMPACFVFHGKQDKWVSHPRVWLSVSSLKLICRNYQASPQSAIRWVDKLKTLQPNVPVKLVLPDGDHCFDREDTLSSQWLRDPILWTEQYWPLN
jgi:acetyl esterase/lipase